MNYPAIFQLYHLSINHSSETILGGVSLFQSSFNRWVAQQNDYMFGFIHDESSRRESTVNSTPLETYEVVSRSDR